MSTTSPQARPSLWRRYLDFPLIWKMAIALVLGAAAGLVVGPPITVLQPLGDLFLRLLQMVVLPLIIVTIIAGVSTLTAGTMGRIGLKAVVFYLLTSALAITVGLLAALAVSPGTGLAVPGTADAPEAQAPPPLAETLLGIVPSNPFEAMVEGNVLAVLFVALIAGIALSFMAGSPDPRVCQLGALLRRGVEGAVELVYTLVRGILQYAPIGVFALIASVMGQTGTDALAPLAQLTAVVYGAVVLQILVYAALLVLFRVGLGYFFGAAKEPMLTAFVTRSSNATLPVSSRAAERMGVHEGVHGFTLPLGATVNMDGTAIYVGAATVFIANIAGVDLTLAQLLTVVAIGALASIGTAGVPGAGLLMLSMTVTQTGLPMAPIALVAGIDALLDMARTMCNVTGDLVATRLIAGTEKGMLTDPDRGGPADAGREPAPSGEAPGQAQG